MLFWKNVRALYIVEMHTWKTVSDGPQFITWFYKTPWKTCFDIHLCNLLIYIHYQIQHIFYVVKFLVYLYIYICVSPYAVMEHVRAYDISEGSSNESEEFFIYIYECNLGICVQIHDVYSDQRNPTSEQFHFNSVFLQPQENSFR